MNSIFFLALISDFLREETSLSKSGYLPTTTVSNRHFPLVLAYLARKLHRKHRTSQLHPHRNTEPHASEKIAPVRSLVYNLFICYPLSEISTETTPTRRMNFFPSSKITYCRKQNSPPPLPSAMCTTMPQTWRNPGDFSRSRVKHGGKLE